MALFKVSGAILLAILSLVDSHESTIHSRECPPLWTRYGDSCYRFFGTPKTWWESEQHCQEFFTRYRQGHLTSVSNREENNFLKQMWNSSLVPNTGDTGNRVWIGLSDSGNEGTFVWSDGNSQIFRQWRNGQPDAQPGENCVDLWTQDGWNDENCDRKLPYLCKMYI